MANFYHSQSLSFISMIKFTPIVFVILCNTINLAFGFDQWKALHKVESSGKSHIVYPSQVSHHGEKALLDQGILVVLEKLY